MSKLASAAPPLARRSILVLVPAVAAVASGRALAANAQQQMVDDAADTIARFAGESAHPDFAKQMQGAVGVLIVPKLIKAGFIIGGEGGGGVLLARDSTAAGWSSPAFYSLASASIGLQAGAQSSETVFVIRSRTALERLMADKIKLGADAGLAVVTVGAGVEGSTTTAAGADILAFSHSKGLYGGLSFEGSVVNPDEEANRSYYGKPVTARQILLDGAASNAGATRLRARLNSASA